jgi:mycothiol system anti-sigma-R factor
MDFQRASEIMFLFLDGELDEEAVAPFQSHLAECGHCACRVAYTRKLLLLVRQRCARHAAPLHLRRRIQVTLRGAIAVLLATLLGLALLSAPPAAAQDLTLTGLNGETLREADLDRGAVVVVVWASWSPRGRDVVARVNQLASRWGGSARVITVNFQEDRQTVEGFLAGKNLRVPVYLDPDGRFAKKNAVTNLPGLLVVKDGRTAFRGKLPDDPDSVLAEILG